MTAREKAHFLIDSYRSELINYTESYFITEQIAKKIALIAVDEIIENQQFLSRSLEYDSLSDRLEKSHNYWQEVKKEINKL